MSLLSRYSRVILWVGIAVNVLTGIFICSYYFGNRFLFFDEGQYYTFAKYLVEKQIYTWNGINPSAWRPPGYPFFLAIPLYFGATISVLRVFNLIFLVASMILVYLIVKRWSPAAAALSVILITCYPVLLYTAGALYPQTMASALFLLALWLVFNAKEISWLRALSVGMVFGLLILTVPTFLCMLGVLAIWLIKQHGKKGIELACYLILGTAVILTPWTVRNYSVFNTFVFVSTNGGYNLFLGNSENTGPNTGTNVEISEYMKRNTYYNLKYNIITEVEFDRICREEAWTYISNNKLQSLKMYGLKFLNYFNFWNEFATKNQKTGGGMKAVMMFLSYGAILSLLVARLLMTQRWPLDKKERLLLLLYVLNGAFMAIFFTRIRLRIPFDYLLIMINAGFLARLLKQTHRGTEVKR